MILNYSDDSIQSLGAAGFDICGFYSSHTGPTRSTYELMAWSGCSYLIRKDVFFEIGMFDEQFFMYAEDIDLSLRITEAGWDVLYWPLVDVIHVGAGSNTGGVRPPAADAAYFRTMAPFISKHRPGIRGRVLALAVRLVSEGMYGVSRMRSVVSGRRQGRAA